MPTPDIKEFLNNPGWSNDISDGSVDATVTFAGASAVNAIGAWVVTTPPDFAPDTGAVTTLLDIAQQAVGTPLPARLTYPQDVEPVLRRAANLFFVNEQAVWKVMHDHMANPVGLNDNSAASATLRKRVRDDLLKAQNEMNSYRLTQRQISLLDQWVQGHFDGQADATRPARDAGAQLDSACLERCVGGGFFPGIEAGSTMRLPTLHAEFARLTRGTFHRSGWFSSTDGSWPPVAKNGLSLAGGFYRVPSDWWPAQRPDLTGRTATGGAGPRWDRGIIVTAEDDPAPTSI